jgi:LysM repeat protein
MRKLVAVVLVLVSAVVAFGQSHQEKYIERFSGIAVSEMYRSGVPASITLAQGLLESGYGRSELALKSNNHFGIKCHNGWQGGKVYHDDDAKGECFRKYDHPEDSYRDHSDFLRYRDRYKFLFDYKVTDYKAWAYGLKKAGYATDPAYPTKLIKLIEDYKLYDFDKKPSSYGKEAKTQNTKKSSHKSHPKEVVPDVIPQAPSQLEQVKEFTGRKREEFNFILSRKMFSCNGVPFVYSMEGETYKSIAESNNLFVKELLKFNDLSKDEALLPGTVVYLQKKKKEAERGLNMHVMEAGETLRDVAQRYGVRIKSLKKINEIDNEKLIREGDIIRLRK